MQHTNCELDTEALALKGPRGYSHFSLAFMASCSESLVSHKREQFENRQKLTCGLEIFSNIFFLSPKKKMN